MLKSLFIENVAVIDRLDIELSPGFTVLTGETGAGKSIIIDSIGMLLGGRVSRDLIRSGESAAAVSAIFDGPQGEVSVERTLAADGRSAVRIDGRPATVAMLRELGETLVSIHGQHDSGWLLQPERHILFVDELANAGELLDIYKASYGKVNALKSKIESLHMDEREKSRRLDMLRFQVEEISGADLVPGEAEKLNERRTVMQNAGRLVRSVGAVCDALDPEDGEGAVSLAGAALRQLNACTSLSDRLAEVAGRLEGSYYTLTDVAGEMRSFLEELDFDPADIDRVERRHDVIHRLCRKYGDTVEAVIAYGVKAAAELEEIELSDERINALEKTLARVYNELSGQAEELSALRQKTADEAQRRIEEELRFLNMPKAKFIIDVRPLADFGPQGRDEVEFLFSANVGEEPRPLAKIASGGELSRVMLALRSVMTGKGDADTLIFDEIDTGVSGSAAEQIGRKLQSLSESRQVLCVTHLPQIACLAANHLVITKKEAAGRTFTAVEPVDGEARAGELARLLSGNVVTPAAMEAAREMLRTK